MLKRGLIIAAIAAPLATTSPAEAQNVLVTLGDFFKGAQSLNLHRISGCTTGLDIPGSKSCELRGTGAELLLAVDTTGSVDVELGLGLTVLSGFAPSAPGMDFHGAARELPIISVYASPHSLPARDKSGLVPWPYAGMSIGITELWNARAYDPERRQFSMDAQTLQTGVLVGASWDINPIASNVTVEAGYRWRRFRSISYGHGSATTVPVDWPRDLNLSGWVFSVGAGVGIRN